MESVNKLKKLSFVLYRNKMELTDSKSKSSNLKYPRFLRFIPRMRVHSNKGLLSHKHAAAVVQNGDIQSLGVNSMRGYKPFHAEVEAVRSYLIPRGLIGWVKTQRILWGRPQRKKEKGSSVYFEGDGQG